MRSVFEKRILVRNKEYGGKDLERLAEKWEKAIRAGAKLYLPKIDRAACQRLACVVVTTPGFGSPHGRSSSLRRTCPSSDSMLTIKYEERTPYSDKRPDVQASFGTRVAARGEIKSMLSACGCHHASSEQLGHCLRALCRWTKPFCANPPLRKDQECASEIAKQVSKYALATFLRFESCTHCGADLRR
ncbi:hypothetical protein BDZ88DRAFT_295201 [Geranomyces variabilis]|nr:hypothetical protein BDZ88DRAFT_295201 [Geranomyces variabilis]